MKILSPMATGNGAYIVHQALARKIKGYQLHGYNPYWTLFPPCLPLLTHGMMADIVHTTPDYGFFFEKKNTPLVLTFHNYFLDQFMMAYSSMAQKIHYRTDLRYFTRKSLTRATVVTSVSRFTADLVRDDLGFRGEIKVIYNGVDQEMFRPEERLPRKKIRVLFSGNPTRRKGADLLPRIARRLDPGIEIVYTRGLQARRHLADSTGVLRDIGTIPYLEMPRVYQDADILLLPTVREGFVLAAIEAMACGLPVVATDCSSLQELVVDGKGGYLCRLADEADFAEKINLLATSPEARRTWGHSIVTVLRSPSLWRK